MVVSIAGKDYSVRGEADEEYIRMLAHYVDERMRGVADQTGVGPNVKAAIMTALQIADELHQIRSRTSGGMKEVGEVLDRAIVRLEDALQE